MSAVVNSVLARCIVDPDFLARLAGDSEEALREYELDARTRSDFAALDVRRLVGLASIVTKVQNNGLWQWLPCTRTLMARYGIETEVFAAFGREHQQLRTHRKTRDEQTARFIAFLQAALDEWIPLGLPALRDVFRHEALQWEIRTEMMREPEEARRGVPRPNGILRVGAYESRPTDAVAAIRAERFVPEHVEPVAHWLVYQGDRTSRTIRIAEISEPAAKVLACVDGRSSIAAIARRAACRRAQAEELVAAAVDAGLTLPANDHAHHLR